MTVSLQCLWSFPAPLAVDHSIGWQVLHCTIMCFRGLGFVIAIRLFVLEYTAILRYLESIC